MERLGVARCDVDDARRRVWLTALRHIERMRPGSEGAFLRTVARREAGHVRRTYRRRSEVTSAELDEWASAALPTDELVARRERLAHANDVLQDMHTDLRRVLLLYEVDEAPTQRIARMLDIPLGQPSRARAEPARTACDVALLEQVSMEASFRAVQFAHRRVQITPLPLASAYGLAVSGVW